MIHCNNNNNYYGSQKPVSAADRERAINARFFPVHTAHFALPRLPEPEALRMPSWMQLAPESRAALSELGRLVWVMLRLVLWGAGFLVAALFVGWWSLLVPVFAIACYCGKREDETKTAEAKRVSEIACPRARHEAEMLAVVKEIRGAQWF